MSLRKKAFKGGALLSASTVLAKLLALARNIILARLISPEDFGIAATFAITLTLIESVSEVAADKLLIQAKDGDDPQFQGTVHLFQVFRNLLTAGVLLAVAGPISRLFSAPQALEAFQWLALVPAIRGFAHTDIRRLQRQLRFKTFVLVDLGSQTAAVIAAGILGWWLGDFRAGLWVVVVQSVFFTALTHAIALRPYRWAFEPGYARRIIKFGWPLMINAVLMFAILQGDRMIIGAAYSMTDLAMYSAAVILLMTPRAMTTKVSTSLLLPLLSRAQDDLLQFTRRYRLCIELMAFIGTLVAVVFVVAGTEIMVMLYGSNYAGVGSFIGILAVMQAVRIMRTATAIAAMAKADSHNLLYSNIVRAVSLILLFLVVYYGLDLMWIAVAGVCGEVLALAASVCLLWRRHKVPTSATIVPAMSSFTFIVAAVLVGWTSSSTLGTALLGIAFGVVAGLGMLSLCGQLRRHTVEASDNVWKQVTSKSVYLHETHRTRSESMSPCGAKPTDMNVPPGVQRIS